MIRAALPLAALAASIAGCAPLAQLGATLPPGAPAAVELAATPFYPQEVHQCGPAALATALSAAGHDIGPDELAGELFIPARRGSLQPEMLGATRRAGMLPYVLEPRADVLVAELAAGHPVVVLQNLGAASWPAWHYAVLIGYDSGRGVALLRSGRKRRLEMRWSRFIGSWERGGRWAVVVLEPGALPATAEQGAFLEAAAGLELAGRLEAAAAAYRVAAGEWPDAALAWLGLGNVAYAGGDVRSAIEAFSRGVSRAPDHAALRNNLAQSLLDAGCAELAITQARTAAHLARGTPLEATAGATLEAAERAAGDPGRARCDVQLLPDGPP